MTNRHKLMSLVETRINQITESNHNQQHRILAHLAEVDAISECPDERLQREKRKIDNIGMARAPDQQAENDHSKDLADANFKAIVPVFALVLLNLSC